MDRADIREWLDCDRHDPGYGIFSDEDIVGIILRDDSEDIEDGGEDMDKQEWALQSVDSILQWAKSQDRPRLSKGNCSP